MFVAPLRFGLMPCQRKLIAEGALRRAAQRRMKNEKVVKTFIMTQVSYINLFDTRLAE